MDKTKFDVAILVGKYLANNLTEEEKAYLSYWLSLSEKNCAWFERVTSESYQIEKGKATRSINVEEGWKALELKREFRLGERCHRIYWMRYVAMFVLPLAITVLLHQVYYSREDKVEMVQTITSGTSKAILILADGLPVVLEQQQERTLKESDGTKINVLKEHISYESGVDDKQEKSVYHELVVPRGGEFSLTLSDGTVVFLNADSRLRYPVKFDRTSRVVELEGEGYFQVARDEQAPFTVKTSKMQVRVLGTEFNVSAYAEDSVIQTTLVQGIVQVTSESNSKQVILQPGEQAELNREDGALHVSQVDVSSTIAWKDGRLCFQEKSLGEIMRIVARWYDVEVVYLDEEVKSYLFGCNFNRHVMVESLLKIFEATGTIDIRVDGQKIFIKKRK